MRMKEQQKLKTRGSQAANLLAQLHEQRRPVFSLRDVVEITRLKDPSARSFVRKLVERGVVTRLRPGLFTLVPFELGREGVYLGNPYVVARQLMGEKSHYVSHGSAMSIHGMVTQPQLVVYVTSPEPMRARSILGMEFRFVRCKRSNLFGTTEWWADKEQKVVVSDVERTIIDGLKQPEHCGGLTEVAKGLWIKRADVNVGKLVDYAVRLGVGAVSRRLGYLLETYRMGQAEELERLRKGLTTTYNLLDPLLPPEGRFVARWRLRLNIGEGEIVAAAGT